MFGLLTDFAIKNKTNMNIHESLSPDGSAGKDSAYSARDF